MKRSASGRRRPAVQITRIRAARLHRLVSMLGEGPKDRDALLAGLEIGLRTFYRELELLQKCGIRVRLEKRLYQIRMSARDAEGRLPFPDPQFSFAEIAELAQGPGAAAKRLADLLAGVVGDRSAKNPRPAGRPSRKKEG